MIIETLIQKGFSLSIKNGLLGVSPKMRITDDLRNYISRNKPQILTELRKDQLICLLAENEDLREQFDFEVEERTAIMIFDGEINTKGAEISAFETTLGHWISLFCD